MFEQNDPRARMIALRQPQQRHRRVLEWTAEGLNAQDKTGDPIGSASTDFLYALNAP
jgi:hypothetical protein